MWYRSARSPHLVMLASTAILLGDSLEAYSQDLSRPYAPVWISDGGQIGAAHGLTSSSAGDVNGDGFDDVIVGAPFYDGAATDSGRISLYLGSYNGLSSQPAATIEGTFPDGWFGLSVSSAGDVNGDGFADVLVGAPREPSSIAPEGGGEQGGRVYLFLGSAGGLVTSPAWVSESPHHQSWYGYVVSSVGDRNGDGFPDIGVGAPLLADGESSGGKVFLFHGGASGFSQNPHEIFAPPPIVAHAQRFGVVIANAGDTNKDGFSEIIIGCSQCEHDQPGEGMAFLYAGSAAPADSTPIWHAEGDQAYAEFGMSLAGAGDIDGDSFPDLIIGAPYYDAAEFDGGRVFLYSGSASGFPASPAWIHDGVVRDGYLGYSVAGVGDLNNDSFADIALGATLHTEQLASEGAAFILFGASNGLSWSSRWEAFGGQADAYLTASLSSAGDINGDGLPEIIVGASGYDNDKEDEGRATVYLMRENPTVTPTPSPSPTAVPTATPTPTVEPTPQDQTAVPLRVVLLVDGAPTSGVPLNLGDITLETNEQGEVNAVLDPQSVIQIRSGSGDITFQPLSGRAEIFAAHDPLYIDASRIREECEWIQGSLTQSLFMVANETIFSLTKQSLRLKARGSWKPKGDFRGPFFTRGQHALAAISELVRPFQGERAQCVRTTTSCTEHRVPKDALMSAFATIYNGRPPAGLAKLQRRRGADIQRFGDALAKLPDSYLRCDHGAAQP